MFVNDVLKQIRSLFEKYIQEEIQSTQFKNAITIILRKSNKKNNSYLKMYEFMKLLDTLSKILKLIVLKRRDYVVEMQNILSNTQMRIRKHKSINTTLQFITKKICII